MTRENAKIAIAYGDGIGPEIMKAVLNIIKAAGARLDLHPVTVGEEAYAAGEKNGISDADFQTLEQCAAFLKAPLGTPQGKGYSSVNVAIRKRFDLFANVRPSLSLEPVLTAKNGKTDMIIVRENLEDLYAGIEYRPTPDTAVGRKVITRSEAERIIRMSFEYARANGREKVTAIAKDNIQKFTDGAHFHQVFDEVAKDYPDIKAEFYIADIGIARLGARPADFDVVVTQNMYGDIASDVVGEALGSIGLSGSANIGESFAMFEAVHGTAPDIAGQGIANPSGLLMAAVMMLNYLGQNDTAEKVHNAWLKAIEDGIHTGDIYRADTRGLLQKCRDILGGGKAQFSKKRVGTADFSRAVIERLGQKPSVLKPVDYTAAGSGFKMPASGKGAEPAIFETTGVDVDVEHSGDVFALAHKVATLFGGNIRLQEIRTVRGDKVWPEKRPAFASDCKTLRLVFDEAAGLNEPQKQVQIADMLKAFSGATGLKWREVHILTRNTETLENNYR